MGTQGGVYKEAGTGYEVVPTGQKIRVESGGIVDFESGSLFKQAGTTVYPAVGVAASYKVARGEATLDGSNPTSVVSGLATVVSAVVTMKGTSAPADDPHIFTVNYGGGVTAGTFDIYAWKNTATDDPTVDASTNSSAVVSWIAIGT